MRKLLFFIIVICATPLAVLADAQSLSITALVVGSSTPTSTPTSTPSVTTTPASSGGGGLLIPIKTPELQLLSIVVTEVTTESAKVIVTTAPESYGEINFGTNDALGRILWDSLYATEHIFNFTTLTADTTYFFKVAVVNSSGTRLSSQILQFHTLVSSIAQYPSNPLNFKARYDNKAIVLTWNNPPETNFEEVLLVRSTTRYPHNSTDGQLLYEGVEERFIDRDVTPNKVYFYGLFARNSLQQISSGVYARVNTYEPAVQATSTPAIPPETKTPPSSQPQKSSTISLKSATHNLIEKTLELMLTTDQKPPFPYLRQTSFTRHPLKIVIDANHLFEGSDELYLILDSGERHRLRYDKTTNHFIADFITPEELGIYGMSLTIQQSSGETDTVRIGELTITQRGTVTQKVYIQKFWFFTQLLPTSLFIDKITTNRVSGATVSLLDALNSDQLWNASEYGQINPQTTNERGEYGYLVPDGTYSLTVTYKETRSATDSFFVDDEIVNKNIELSSIHIPWYKVWENLIAIAIATLSPVLISVLVVSIQQGSHKQI